MTYKPPPPTVSPTIELEQARANLQLAIQYLHELRQEMAALPIGEVENSATLTSLWDQVKRINLDRLCEDEIPF